MSEQQVVTKDQIIEALKTVEDPELFLDIWFLGLIYKIDIQDGSVAIEMTFTSPMCPAGPMLVEQVRTAAQAVPGVEAVEVKVTFVPAWTPSDEVKGMLGML